ncbi:toll-like receptor 5 [Emydura macquarii macquarii]|uniref:toll-like receptor 5 n=1 Tax=Emydura macquarii macquarii TaxID=1129001 RepID=UPI00352B723D
MKAAAVRCLQHKSTLPQGSTMLRYAWLLALWLLGSSPALADAGNCHFFRVQSSVVSNCQAQRHETVPEIDPSTQILLLNFNFLSNISASSFPRLERLRKLSLGYQLGGSLSIGEKAFEKVANVTFLDLGGNRKLSLQPMALAGLRQLEVLLLDANGLDEAVLEGGYFHDLVSLKRLDLTGNQIKRLRPDSSFQGLKLLASLQLRLNRIKAICGEDLTHLSGRHLSLLDLSSNLLSYRDPWYNHSCPNPFHNIIVETLDVSSNPWDVGSAERFFKVVAGAQIWHLKLQHSGAIGRGFGFNNLQGLSASTFSGLSWSRVLSFDMSHGFLSKLGPLVFSGLPELRALRLASNQIHEIRGDAFAGLRHLRTLDLSHNLLGELFTEALQSLSLSPLLHLNLKSNHIGAIQYNALEGLSTLRTLDLQDNALSRVPPGRLPALERLLLGQNRIKDAWGIGKLSTNLTFLDLSSNHMQDLSGLWNELRAIPALQFLNLSHNLISVCSEHQDRATPRQSQLRVLDLSQNSLNSIWNAGGCVDVFHHLEKLTALNLSRNNLQTLPKDLFQGLVSLQALDLSGNLMTMLPDGLFRDLRSLQVLGLHSNHLVTLSLSVLQPLQALAFLNLQGVSLLCHCSLQDLEAWLHSTNMTLSGGIGVTCLTPIPPFSGMPLLSFIQSSCVQ